MEKFDLTKKYKNYFTAKTKPTLSEIEPAQFLSITGKGDPSGDDFAGKIQAMYPVAYTLKFAFKSKGKDFTVSKLEALWWFDMKKYGDVGMDDAPVKIPRKEWEYRILIRLPEFVKRKDVERAVEEVFSKKNISLVRKLEYHEMNEGKCVQMLHVGPFDKEPETLRVMQGFMEENNFRQNGLHHEIYLSDFRKTTPVKLKTILREPVV
jgi:hypothetical protein